MPRLSCIVLAVVPLAIPTPSRADDFDRLEGPALAAIPGSKLARPHERLTIAEIGTLPNVLAGVRSAPIVATTDQGNIARLLAVPGLRKPPGGEGDPVPILVLERFETFEAPRAVTRLARGREMILFDGFQLDLDSGQVVPDGQGGDLRFLASGEGGPRLVASGKARLYTLSASPLQGEPKPAGPSRGRAIVASDFAGRYRLFANGQWSGSLDLVPGENGAVGGSFRSDQTGTVYKVTGQVSAENPQRIDFEAQMPRVRLEFTGFLWAEGKGALAGTASLLGRTFGFFALRDGSLAAAEGQAPSGPAADDGKADRQEVEMTSGGQLSLDGKPIENEALAAALAEARKASPTTYVLLKVPGDASYSAVARAVETIRAAGIEAVRLAPAGPSKESP
jgi:hypothetical protein